MSRFHGLLLVRDEEDIIEECLRANLEWADSIWVLDTGSSDATWEIVNRLAAEDPRVRPLVKRDLLFGQHLRSYMFHKARGAFQDGDWVVKLDADEFYEVPPPEFVRRFVSPQEGCIYYICMYFRITSWEVAAYENGKIDLTHDRRRPISERRRFYKIIDYTEPRMFRYRTSMKFRETDSFPRFAGLVARRLIPMRHYPHRDPVQLRRRYKLRSCMKRMGALESKHWDAANWRIDVINIDHGIGSINTAAGLALEDGQDSGPLRYWAPGEALPSTFDRTYDEPPLRRLLKRVFYRWGVRIADRFAKGFEDDAFLDRNRLPAAQALAPPVQPREAQPPERPGEQRTVPVSVIIPTMNRPDMLVATLRRILACDPGPDEVLVHVDGGDGTTAAAVRDGFATVTVLECARTLGPGGGRSALVAAARNNLVASFDDDSFPVDPGYFGRLHETATAHPDAAVIAACIHHPGERPPASTDRRSEASGFIGCGCAFRKDAFARLGGFVPLPLAYGMEESDLALRLRAAGQRIIVDQALRVRHETTLAHHARPELTAASIRNLALLAFLRYPPSLWWLGFAQVANRVLWLVGHGRRSGVLHGLASIPAYLWRYRAWRATLPAEAVRSWTRARRAEATRIPAPVADAE